ncbi:MAG: hypothetical protein JNG86_16235 [Verrucomicrobiaceae bacterium]|nr:hypothetical protein [Verrucomicrobiaceae bacterium]
MQFIDKLESKFGRFAIPGLVQTIAVFQLGVLALILMMDKESAENYLQFLVLDAQRVLRGEVWRLVTHVFIPRSFSIIWAVLGTMVMMWIGRGLEQAWSSFRVNLYILAWMASVTAGNLIFGWGADALFLYQSLFFAFAVFYPNEEIYVYFILPVKVKWLALISAGLTGFAVMQSPGMLLPVLAGHLNFLITFAPGLVRDMRQAAKVGERRTRYEAASRPAGEFFHQCSVCKKTEIDDARLDFRVLASGDEICHVCRENRDGDGQKSV